MYKAGRPQLSCYYGYFDKHYDNVVAVQRFTEDTDFRFSFFLGKCRYVSSPGKLRKGT